jgi:formylglycine-generating enzyme required for sulfatase activity
MEMVWVPEGCYEMGCGSWTSDCRRNENPAHEVCVDGFWIGKHEVTQGQWRRVMGTNPSHFKKGDGFPVEQVSWNDAQEFVRKLKSMNGGKYEFRLPTEAEWEYACRSGGKPEKHSGGEDIDQVAWYSRNSGSSTQKAGTKAPNGLGIHDMSGNVWEWVEDIYDGAAYHKHPRNNPVTTGGGSYRVERGVSWFMEGSHARCGYRRGSDPADRGDDLGFRVARTP